MIKSMTAFARNDVVKESLSVATEIRSYNSRYLDIALHIPKEYYCFEERIKSIIKNQVTRGRLDVKIKISNDLDEKQIFEIDLPRAKGLYSALSRLKEMFQIDAEISLDQLLNSGGILTPVEPETDLKASFQVVTSCLNAALNDLVKVREAEGRVIAKDFSMRLEYIKKRLDRIEKESGDGLSYYSEQLKERIAVLTKGVVDLSSDRIAQEAAFFANRSDITEEIVRINSHLNQFHAIMQIEESEGRKLNFLLQELSREFNTIGSKTEKYSVSHDIVEIKTELEKIREQVQNIE